MKRTWKKLILRIKHESFREKVYLWFKDQNPYGFWEKNGLTIIAYVRDWPKDPYPDYIIESFREEEADENWVEEWQKRFKPIEVENTIRIRPPWEPSSSFLIDLVIYPAYAFGTGDHPTTFCCLKFIVHYLKPGMSFLDVGMGSGILSLLAVRLGAGEVTSIDIDPLAIEELKRNCHFNQIPFERIHAKTGDLSGVKGSYDFIVANIGKQFLLENLSILSRMLNISGYIVLSGYQVGDSLLIQGISQSQNLWLIESSHQENWVTQIFQKKK